MSYTPQYKPAETSADGVNSSSLTTGPLWSGNVWTGAGEQNDYNYVGVNLQSQSGGTLTFEFSQNGTDWSKYPVAEFTVAAGINEVHGAWKGTRYVRPRFTADGIGTYFRIRTMYSYDPIVLSAPLNQSINTDSDANIVRAVSIGEVPGGSYTNQKIDGVGFQTTDNLASGATFSSDVVDAQGYTQVQTNIVCDNDGTLGFKFCSTANCTGTTSGQNGVERYLSVPYSSSGGFQLFSAPAFTPYVQYTFTNNGTGTTTQLFYETKLLTKGLSGQLLGMDAFISPSMISNLGRNVQVGKDPNGVFTNTKVDGNAFESTQILTTAGVGLTYTSPITSTEGYSQIETIIQSDVSGILVGTWYSDEAGTKVIRTFTRPYANNEVGQIIYFSAPAFGPYVKYEYTSNSDQSEFLIQFNLRTKSISGQVLGMNDFIPGGVVANLGRNVIVGQNDAGRFNNVKTDTLNNLNVNVKNPRTAFGELRMAELTPELQVNYVYGINTDIVVTGNTSGGTVSSSDSMAIITSSASANSWGDISTKQSIKYSPGQGSVARFTCVFTDGVSGNTQFIGVVDSEDGFAFGFSGDTFGLLRRQNSVDFFTPQTSWNIDTMDGSSGALNPSAQLIDPTKGNVFEIKYQYLGFGAITYSIEQGSDGEFVPVHIDKYANTATVPSIYSPNLPITMRSENTTNTTDITMKSASMAGFVEGKRVLTGPIRSFSNSKAAGTPHTFSIRNSTTFGGRTNKVRVYIQLISTTADGTQPVVVNLLKNATLSAPSWQTIANSPIETDISNSTITGGQSILSFGLAKVDSKIVQAQQEFVYEVDPGDIITVQTDGSTNAGWSATLSWTEDI
jgi:hypothetical protein